MPAVAALDDAPHRLPLGVQEVQYCCLVRDKSLP